MRPTDAEIRRHCCEKLMNSHGNQTYRVIIVSIAFAIFSLTAAVTRAEDGYRLWLRYDSLPKQNIDLYGPHVTAVVVQGNSPALDAAREELVNGCSGL